MNGINELLKASVSQAHEVYQAAYEAGRQVGYAQGMSDGRQLMYEQAMAAINRPSDLKPFAPDQPL